MNEGNRPPENGCPPAIHHGSVLNPLFSECQKCRRRFYITDLLQTNKQTVSLLPVGGKEVLSLMRPVLIREPYSCTCINAKNCLEKISFWTLAGVGALAVPVIASLKRLLPIYIYSHCLDRCVTQQCVCVPKAKGKLSLRFTQIRNAPSEPAGDLNVL